MESRFFGTFSICVNKDRFTYKELERGDVEAISRYLIDEFNRKAEHKELPIRATHAEITRGCWIITIALGYVAGKAIGKAYSFIKDYDKLRSNVLLIISDFKNLFLSAKKKNDEAVINGKEFKGSVELPEDIKECIELGRSHITLESSVVVTRIAVIRVDVKETHDEAIHTGQQENTAAKENPS